MKRTIMILADGARPDVLRSYLGQMPHLSQLISRGSFKNAVSVWPSTTGPAHLPMLTGRFPGDLNMPGVRWFDRNELFPEVGLGALKLRSYIGWKGSKINSETELSTPTLFELAKKPRSVLEVFKKGLKKEESVASFWDRLRVPRAHFSGDYVPVDLGAIDRATQALKEDPDFLFLLLPGIDGHSHHTSPTSADTKKSYMMIDLAIEKLSLIEQKLPGETLWIICSDHGHSEVQGHIDFDLFLKKEGFRVACHSRRLFQPRPNAVVAVSGNSMAHIYLRGSSWKENMTDNLIISRWPGLLEKLVSLDEVDILIVKNSDTKALIWSKRGRAFLSINRDIINYQPISGDPFGFDHPPAAFTKEDSLNYKFDGDYPDVLFQISQIIKSNRSGDILLSAAPGYDFRNIHEFIEHKSGHGALHREHMLVPLISSMPIDPGPARTTDIFDYVCDYMEWDR